MRWVTNIIFVLTALFGAVLADYMSQDMPVVPRAHKKITDPSKENIVRFSKHYACQTSDQACIEHGKKKFSGLSTGLMN